MWFTPEKKFSEQQVEFSALPSRQNVVSEAQSRRYSEKAVSGNELSRAAKSQ